MGDSAGVDSFLLVVDSGDSGYVLPRFISLEKAGERNRPSEGSKELRYRVWLRGKGEVKGARMMISLKKTLFFMG